MTDEQSNREKARRIVSLLPRENCGKCGFNNCGGFALAIVEGKASPFGCHENPSAGYEICKVLGIETPEEAKVSSGYSRYSQIGVAPGMGMERGIGVGYGHHGGHHHGHHGHGLGRGKGRGEHHHLLRHLVGRHSH